MKIEQLLVQHFYNTKEVTLQGLGTFRLSPDFIMPPENDKELEIPANSISFEHNSRATEDDALINFIVQQTRKMKPLAAADLDSYLVLGKQFLNIGKPFKIEGLGLLMKSQQGEYEFTQGRSFQSKAEAIPVDVKEKLEEDEISFASEGKSSFSPKKGLLIAAIVIGLGMIGITAWYFLVKNKDNKPEPVTETPAVKQDTPNVTKVNPDSSLKKTDSNSVTAPLATNNNDYTFKVVIKNYPSLFLAQKAYNRLSGYGHKLLLYTSDSVTFKVALPLYRPLADTTRAKDSVRLLLFGGNPYVELK